MRQATEAGNQIQDGSSLINHLHILIVAPIEEKIINRVQ